MIAVWLSPLLVFVGLLASRLTSTLAAAAVATAVAMLVAWGGAPRPSATAEIVGFLFAGLWIALPAVLVILAGLFFAEATRRHAPPAGATAADHRTLASTCLVAGPFLETATGFGVGYVVALVGVSRLGISGGRALALAAFSQYLVPWGALGVGTRISAEIADLPVDALAFHCAIITAFAPCFILPLFWRLSREAGLAPSRRDRVEWIGTMALQHTLLVVTNLTVPIEFAGLATLGAVLVLRHLLFARRSGTDSAHWRTALPYIALVLLLALTRFVAPVRAALETFAMEPFPELSAFAPLMSPAVPLVLIGLVVGWRRGGAADVARHWRATLGNGWRAAALTFLLVGMAWIMVRAGLSVALMERASDLAGPGSPALVALVGGFGGYLTGSNTGAGAISMPLISGLALGPSDTLWIAAAAVFAGSILTAISPVRFAMGQALLGATRADVRMGFRALVPYASAALLTAIAATLLTALE